MYGWSTKHFPTFVLLQVWELGSGQCVASMATQHTCDIMLIAVTQDGAQAVTGGQGELCVWRLC